MENTDFNQLARCADYINGHNSGSNDDLDRLSSDDDFASDAINIAEISALASKSLSKKRNVSIIPIIAIAAAAAVVAFFFIPKSTTIETTNPASTQSMRVSTLASVNSDEIIAQDGIANISWNFAATQGDTLVIYDLNGNAIIKKPISGNSATVAMPSKEQKYIYKIERNATDIVKKGTIIIR